MKPQTKKEINEHEALTNFLKNCFTKDENFFIYVNPMRVKKKYCLAQKSKDFELGYTSKSNFMTYDEMNCFFMGMLAITDNRVKFN